MHVCACAHPRARLPTRTHANACTHRPTSNTYCFSTATVIRERASLLRYMYIVPFVTFLHHDRQRGEASNLIWNHPRVWSQLSFLQETVYTHCEVTLLSDCVYTQHVSALMLRVVIHMCITTLSMRAETCCV